MRSPVVFAWSLVILHGILAESNISQMYNLMGTGYSTVEKFIYKNLGTMHKFTCGIKCRTDESCRGFIHTFKGECHFLSDPFFSLMARRKRTPGAKMYWKVGGMESYWRYEDRFYMHLRADLSGDKADDICKFFKGTVIIPKNSKENEFIVPLQNTTWLGIKRVKGIFVNQYTGAPLDYTNWKDGEPDYRLGDEDCAFMDDGGVWHVKQCHEKALLTCQMYVRDCWEGYEDQRCFSFTH
ncbi:mannose-binding protein-like [Penaeus japonicus]|uniref:mannose-binding protein-like n=1 Tax=Penaeus japonicus TaxID=27405 RepID=UPI001C70C534|nr:mannose-binding protein-like [Penaeus japonicus]